jgi:hypothetical protein
MEPPYERLVELSKRLRAATDAGQLEWKAEEDTAFLWKGVGGSVGVRSRDRDGEEPYELEVFTAARQKVESLGSEWLADEQPAPWNEAVAGLYRAARRRALGVDDLLEDLMAEVPRVPGEATAPSKH